MQLAPKKDKYDSPKLEGGKKDLKADAKEAKQVKKPVAKKKK